MFVYAPKFESKFSRRIKKSIAKRVDRIRNLTFIMTRSPESIRLDAQKCFQVQQSEPSVIKHAMHVLGKLGMNYESLLDIGCGTGAAMRLFRRYDFKKIHGIEISKEISKIAQRNFSILKDGRIGVFNCDATEFQYYSNYNLFYFANPFPASVMETVISRLAAQVKDNDVGVVYYNPTCADVLKAHGFTVEAVIHSEHGLIHIYKRNKNAPNSEIQ